MNKTIILVVLRPKFKYNYYLRHSCWVGKCPHLWSEKRPIIRSINHKEKLVSKNSCFFLCNQFVIDNSFNTLVSVRTFVPAFSEVSIPLHFYDRWHQSFGPLALIWLFLLNATLIFSIFSDKMSWLGVFLKEK